MLMAGQYLDSFYIYASQEKIGDICVPELMGRHMEVHAINNILVVRGPFPKHRRHCMLDFLSIDIPGIGTLFRTSDGDIFPQSRPLGTGERLSVPACYDIIRLRCFLDRIQAVH